MLPPNLFLHLYQHVNALIREEKIIFFHILWYIFRYEALVHRERPRNNFYVLTSMALRPKSVMFSVIPHFLLLPVSILELATNSKQYPFSCKRHLAVKAQIQFKIFMSKGNSSLPSTETKIYTYFFEECELKYVCEEG